nr:hypothetical protein [Mycobacteroides chelonae]
MAVPDLRRRQRHTTEPLAQKVRQVPVYLSLPVWRGMWVLLEARVQR